MYNSFKKLLFKIEMSIASVLDISAVSCCIKMGLRRARIDMGGEKGETDV